MNYDYCIHVIARSFFVSASNSCAVTSENCDSLQRLVSYLSSEEGETGA